MTWWPYLADWHGDDWIWIFNSLPLLRDDLVLENENRWDDCTIGFQIWISSLQIIQSKSNITMWFWWIDGEFKIHSCQFEKDSRKMAGIDRWIGVVTTWRNKHESMIGFWLSNSHFNFTSCTFPHKQLTTSTTFETSWRQQRRFTN